MTQDERDPYATSEQPVVPVDVPDDEAPTVPIPAVPAHPSPYTYGPVHAPTPTAMEPPMSVPGVETTARMPAVPWRRRRFPWGATVRRVLLRFLTALALLIVASLWSQLLVLASGGATPSLADLEVPPVEPLAVWAALFVLVSVAADVGGWWAITTPKLPSRMLTGWVTVAVVVIRPLHARREDIEAVTDTAGWMMLGYVVAMAITVAMLRWLPTRRWPPAGSAQVSSVLVGTTVAMLTVVWSFDGAYPGAGWIRPVYEWAFSWIDPGLGGDRPLTAFVVVAFMVGVSVRVFDHHWGGLGAWRFLPMLVALLALAALFVLAPWETVSGAVVGLPLWVILLGTRGPRRHLPR